MRARASALAQVRYKRDIITGAERLVPTSGAFLHLRSQKAMKLLLSLIFLAALIAAAVAQSEMAPPSPTVPVDQANARKAKATLDQAIQALGGSAYLNLQDISQEGRTYSFYHGRPNSVGVVFWRSHKY